MHYLFDTEARVQLTNSSDFGVTALSIVSLDNSAPPILIVPDSLLTDSTSWVYTTEYTGSFNLSLSIYSIDTTKQIDTLILFNAIDIAPGSVRFDFQWPPGSPPALNIQ